MPFGRFSNIIPIRNITVPKTATMVIGSLNSIFAHIRENSTPELLTITAARKGTVLRAFAYIKKLIPVMAPRAIKAIREYMLKSPLNPLEKGTGTAVIMDARTKTEKFILPDSILSINNFWVKV